jgi:hypothetical protein
LDYEKFIQNEGRNDFTTEFEHGFAERTRFANPRREAKKQKMNEDIDQQETDDEDQQETDHEDQQDEHEIADMNGKEGNEEEEDDQEEQEVKEEDQQDLQGFESMFHEAEKMLDKLSQLHCMKQNEEEQYEQEMEEMGKKAIMNGCFEMNPEIEDEFMSSDEETLQPEHQPNGEGMEEQPQQKKE